MLAVAPSGFAAEREPVLRRVGECPENAPAAGHLQPATGAVAAVAAGRMGRPSKPAFKALESRRRVPLPPPRDDCPAISCEGRDPRRIMTVWRDRSFSYGEAGISRGYAMWPRAPCGHPGAVVRGASVGRAATICHIRLLAATCRFECPSRCRGRVGGCVAGPVSPRAAGSFRPGFSRCRASVATVLPPA